MPFEMDHWHEVFQSLRRNRLRTFLTACGIFWGVFMLVAMLGMGRGLERAVTSDFGSWAMNVVFIWSDVTSLPHDGRQPGRKVQLTLDDAEQVAARIKGVELVLPRNWLGGRGSPSQVSRKDKKESFGISGESPDYVRLENLVVQQGRFLNPLDMEEYRKVAIIGTRVREALFGKDESPIGETIKVGSVSFVVVGVYGHPGVTGAHADWMNGRVLVPRTTFSRTFATANRADALAVLVSPDRPSSQVEQEVRAFLKARHHVHPDDPRGIGSFNREKEFGKITGLFLGISTLTWVVGVLTLLAGAIGVSNIMMIGVAERTKEIGIRKAIGATPWSIMGQIVQESTLLTALAGYLGLVAGVGALEIVGRIVEAMPAQRGPQFFTRPELDLSKALIAALILTVSGGLAGLAPARSAVAVRPAHALAHE